jgi:hypothetical protein
VITSSQGDRSHLAGDADRRGAGRAVRAHRRADATRGPERPVDGARAGPLQQQRRGWPLDARRAVRRALSRQDAKGAIWRPSPWPLLCASSRRAPRQATGSGCTSKLTPPRSSPWTGPVWWVSSPVTPGFGSRVATRRAARG